MLIDRVSCQILISPLLSHPRWPRADRGLPTAVVTNAMVTSGTYSPRHGRDIPLYNFMHFAYFLESKYSQPARLLFQQQQRVRQSFPRPLKSIGRLRLVTPAVNGRFRRPL
ncbi:hypothetical protein EVAR_3906_1 [Eumeta japonica]|uniref:Uncharacterized protein n=1 Tax=Eumeta variegata TaxID=151549 RepID=A0A4C1SQP6_EUMVA|nr:hypothetical protein EVAR_3906_1 [Eumeta japonica]